MKVSKQKTVDQLIGDAVRAAGNVSKKVQIAAIAVLEHAKAHGDYSKAKVLVDGLASAKSVRADSLVAWFIAFGGLKIDPANPSAGFIGWSGAEKIDLEGAESTPWESVKKAPSPYKGFVLKAEILKLLSRAEAALGVQGEDKEKVDVDEGQLEALRAIIRPQEEAAA